MKAAFLTGHGGPEKFQYGEQPDPVAGPGEVVVDIHAASVNAADYKVRLGSYDSKLKFPYILGRDFSGIVASRAADVTDIAVGDAVFGVCDAGIEGAYAGLRPGLIDVAAKLPGSRILDGQFTAVQQAVGTPKKNAAGFAFLRDFIEEAKRSGIVASLIERHGVTGRLSVAPAT